MYFVNLILNDLNFSNSSARASAPQPAGPPPRSRATWGPRARRAAPCRPEPGGPPPHLAARGRSRTAGLSVVAREAVARPERGCPRSRVCGAPSPPCGGRSSAPWPSRPAAARLGAEGALAAPFSSAPGPRVPTPVRGPGAGRRRREASGSQSAGELRRARPKARSHCREEDKGSPGDQKEGMRLERPRAAGGLNPFPGGVLFHPLFSSSKSIQLGADVWPPCALMHGWACVFLETFSNCLSSYFLDRALPCRREWTFLKAFDARRQTALRKGRQFGLVV